MNSSPAKSEKLAKSLRGRIAGEVFVDSYRRALYSTDASPYQLQPLAVVLPRNRADVTLALAAAADLNMPLIARGSGTSLSGQSIGEGLVLDFSKYMNQIVQIDPQRRTARVQPGVVLDALNAAAAPHGLQFGPDVASANRASIGGMIGNNSAGARSIVYGKTVDHVIALDVLLSDGQEALLAPLDANALKAVESRQDRIGQIYRDVARIVAEHRDEILARFPRIVRRVSGYNIDEFLPEFRELVPVMPGVQAIRQAEQALYPGANFNLAKLVVGAEGGLACVVEAMVHLVPLPKHRGVMVLHFDSMTAAVAALQTVLAAQPSAAELLDGEIVRMARKSLEYKHYLDFVVGDPDSLVLVEISRETAAEVHEAANELTARLTDVPGLTHVLAALEPALCNHVWACRKAALPLLMGVPGARKPIAFVEDTAVDPARLSEFVARFRKIMLENGTDGAYYGHASVGCLHIRPMLDMSSRNDIARFQRISRSVADLVIEFGGSMSGEHGDGLARSYLNEQLFGPKLYRAFKKIKTAFDPAGIMNPGKVVDGPMPTEHLRRAPDQRLLDIATHFDFTREGGFARAAELCNGSGVCRKTQTGTMCPSFMATGDEEHSTRGRANALRLVLSGSLPASELTGERLYKTFDLCLQCKGCKAECPSNVDVAKLKAEYLSHYYNTHGVPLGVRLMANVARVNRLGSALAPVSNWLTALPGARWLAEKLLHFDRRRPLPQFQRQNFARWFAGHQRQQTTSAGTRGPIVLLDDCLNGYCSPGVNQAAVEVLEALGYEVHLAGITCCGRAEISKGLLKQAKQLAERNLQTLLPWAERGVPIVGCEPSCLVTLMDDYFDLCPGESARKVAEAAALIETHLVRHQLLQTLPFTRAAPQPTDVLLHGHCHQRAIVGMDDTVSLLKSMPGTQVKLVDSGCCGMAGSFGYEHYDLSMTIGQRVLFPAVAAAGSARIVAPGFSCRQQIQHGASRSAQHPIELLAERLQQTPAL